MQAVIRGRFHFANALERPRILKDSSACWPETTTTAGVEFLGKRAAWNPKGLARRAAEALPGTLIARECTP
jgi:hypothetical protein